jgi:hypothetical protein
MPEEIMYGTVNLTPLIEAAAQVDPVALDAALSRLTDEEVAFVCDLGTYINLRAGLKLSERIAAKAERRGGA